MKSLDSEAEIVDPSARKENFKISRSFFTNDENFRTGGHLNANLNPTWVDEPLVRDLVRLLSKLDYSCWKGELQNFSYDILERDAAQCRLKEAIFRRRESSCSPAKTFI